MANQNKRQREMLRLAKNSGKQADVTIEGTKFILQHPGFRSASQLRDRSKNQAGTGLSEEKYFAELMKHVVVDPKIDYDKAEELLTPKGFSELMDKASTFLMGDQV